MIDLLSFDVISLNFLSSWNFLPDRATMLAYTLACFVLFITPGPDMSLWLAKTVQGGPKAGIASMLGTSLGCLIHTFAAAWGLSALIAASTSAFTAVKIIGALYLGWLAFDAIRNGSSLHIAPEAEGGQPLARIFWTGVGINLTNPKVVLFFLTFLPQFIHAGDPHAPERLFFLGSYFIIINLPLAILMIMAADRFISLLKQRPGLMRGIDYAFAGIFGFFAIQVLRTHSR